MKKKILLTALLVIVFILGADSIRTWQKRHDHAIIAEQQLVIVRQQSLIELQQVTLNEHQAKEDLKQQCRMEVVNYDALPTAQKAKTTRPNCDLQLVE